ncbi:MBL fold metallo-hydrolase [Natronomonas sp. EA1]|uniref:MBL fold metallo-hydrolase n=1 Tax=Natronomonas sp. EA1 TaxID=3421655 RepID=UPI003EBD1EDF
MASFISAEELRDRIDAGETFTIVDTRGEESFDAWHIAGAIRYTYKPHHAFDAAEFKRETGLSESDSIVTICAKGISSVDFGRELSDAGFEDVAMVEDGMQAWSAVYDIVDLPVGVDLVQVQRRAKGCLSYVVASEGEAAVIDPTRHTGEYTRLADERGWEITHVFDTHVHADHISGGRALADATGASYHLGANATDREVAYEYDALSRNEVVQVGEVPIKALYTPGHTSEMVSYLIGSVGVATGDTLFVDSVGRTELQFGDGEAATGARELYESLHRTLLAEPESVEVLPGHFALANDGTSHQTPGEPIHESVGAVRQALAVLGEEKDSFVAQLTESLPEKPPNYETVIGVNRGHDSVDDEQAIELELGPNRCAAE